jgi:hypothetical protein
VTYKVRRCFAFSVLLGTGAVNCFGEPPIAKIISNEPIEINGIMAPARNYIPIGLGGEVSTHSSTAVIQFSDGSTVSLQPNSQLRIEGSAGSPRINLLRGSAQSKLTPGSHTRFSAANQTDRVVDQLINDKIASRAATASPAVSDALMYRATANRSANAILPGSPVSAGAFSVASISQGTFLKAAATTPGGTAAGPTIITPSGLVINLTAQVNPTTGAVSYTVGSITQTVTEPNGIVSTVQVTSGTLIGATVSGVTSSTSSGSTVAISVTPVGQTTPLTPAQAAQAVQTSVNTAFQTAVQSGQLQTGTKPPSPSPVSIGVFSPSAP